jgi:hypothetical protein
MRRRWIEATIIALVTVGIIVLHDHLLGGAATSIQLLGLLVAALVICVVQYLISSWHRSK